MSHPFGVYREGGGGVVHVYSPNPKVLYLGPPPPSCFSCRFYGASCFGLPFIDSMDPSDVPPDVIDRLSDAATWVYRGPRF